MRKDFTTRYEEIFQTGQPHVYVAPQYTPAVPTKAKARELWASLKESIINQHIARLEAGKYPNADVINTSQFYVYQARKSSLTDFWRTADVFEKLSDDLTTRAVAKFLKGNPDCEVSRKELDNALSCNWREKQFAQKVREGKANVSTLILVSISLFN